MGETTDQVKEEADQARERLAEDLHRLEHRIESLSDWRTWYQRYPAYFVGAAFLGALLLGLALSPLLQHRHRAI
jgi:hypothetical protein